MGINNWFRWQYSVWHRGCTKCADNFFYEKLYTSQETNDEIAKKFRKTITTKLSDEQNDILNSDITEDEILAGLESMNNNKIPGPDGIIVEFYKEFWRLLVKICPWSW